MKYFWFFLAVVTLGFCTPPAPMDEAYQLLASHFTDPPMEARPKALWTWLNGNADLPTLSREMAEAHEQGLGGFDIWDVGMIVDPDSVVPDGVPFMGEESVRAIGHVLREARQYGMEMGLTIASSWNAGGSWVKEEHGVMGLFRSAKEVRGPGVQTIDIPQPSMEAVMQRGNAGRRRRMLQLGEDGLPGFRKDVALLAFPLRPDSTLLQEEVVDLSAFLEQDSFTWEVPAGNWLLIRYTCIPTGQPLAVPGALSKGLMIDHFSAEAMRSHLKYFFDRLIPEVGNLGESALAYFYNDSYEANSAAWTPELPAAFERLRGYPLTAWLPVLDGFEIESEDLSQRFAYDFRKTLSDLIIANHYALGSQLCHEQGIGFAAEAGGPGPPVHNVPFQDLAALGSLDIPRGEFWYKHPGGRQHMDELQIVKGISSAAHIYDQKFVEAESFTSIWLWQEGPMDLKPVADKAFCEGLNRIVYHTFPHIPPGAGHPGWIYNFGTVMNTQRTWWPKSRDWNDYLARVSYLLQQGNFVADVAWYYGNEAPNFVGHKRTLPWLGEGYDYDVINTEVLLEKLEVRDGRLTLPHGQTYSVLVLPEDRRMELAVIQKIRDLVEQGAIIIGPPPSKVYSLHDYETKERELQDLSAEIWGPCDSVRIREHPKGKGKIVWGKTAREALEELGLVPDFRYENEGKARMEYIHRSLPDHDIYFVRSADSVFCQTGIQLRATGKPELWDPVTGEIYPLPVYRREAQSTVLTLPFAPHQSYLIVFRKRQQGDHIEEITQDGRTLFPGNGPVYYTGPANGTAGLYFTLPGTYQLKYASGRIDRLEVARPEIETLGGPWQVSFDTLWDAPQKVTFDTLTAWNDHADPGIQVYSGLAVYTCSFNVERLEKDGKIRILDLGEIDEVAQVSLNGQNLGIRSFYPFAYDITALVRNQNELRVEVANLLNNRLVGEGRKPPGERKTRSNITKLPSAWATPMGEAPLKKSGMTGPVTIKSYSIYQPGIR